MKTRVGICGAGRVSGLHAEGFIRAGAQVVAFADPVREAATQMADRYGAEAFDTLTEMLMQAKPELVCIATPHDLHVPQATEALEWLPRRLPLRWFERLAGWNVIIKATKPRA